MEKAYFFTSLLCPVSMIAMVAWVAWAIRRAEKAPAAAPTRSVADDAEITRLRAHVDQLEAHDRDRGATRT